MTSPALPTADDDPERLELSAPLPGGLLGRTIEWRATRPLRGDRPARRSEATHVSVHTRTMAGVEEERQA